MVEGLDVLQVEHSYIDTSKSRFASSKVIKFVSAAVMGNTPLCISQQAADGVFLGEHDSHQFQPALRCLSGSPDLQGRLIMEEIGEGGRGREEVGAWDGLSEDVEGEREEGGECDLILGLELFQDSVSDRSYVV